eukprot:6459979-Amphidinium_carterae.5
MRAQAPTLNGDATSMEEGGHTKDARCAKLSTERHAITASGGTQSPMASICPKLSHHTALTTRVE